MVADKVGALLVAVLASWGCASRPEPPPEKPEPPPPPQLVAPTGAFALEFPQADRIKLLTEALPKVEAVVREHFERGRAPGLAFALLIDGAVAKEITLGDADLEPKRPVTNKTRFRVGSLTKTFTAAAVLSLVRENALSLDEPIENLLPEAERVLYPSSDSPKITVAHLLSHQGGLPMNGNYDLSASAKEPPTQVEVLASLDALVLEAPPGARVRYSNLGFSLLGVLIERAAGMPYRAYLDKVVLAPAGIRSASWEGAGAAAELGSRSFKKRGADWAALPFEKLGASEADGGLWLDLPDLARWAALFSNAHPARSGDDKGLLPRQVLRDMMAGKTASNLSEVAGSTRAFQTGYAWHSNVSCHGDRVVSHLGGIDGYAASIEILPEHGVALVALANGAADLSALSRDVRQALQGSGGLSARQPVITPVLSAQAKRFIELRNEFSDAGFDALFTPYFRSVVSAADQKSWAQESVDKVGVCDAPVLRLARAARDGSFEVKCAKGWGKVDVRLSAYGDEIAALSSQFFAGDKPAVKPSECP